MTSFACPLKGSTSKLPRGLPRALRRVKALKPVVLLVLALLGDPARLLPVAQPSDLGATCPEGWGPPLAFPKMPTMPDTGTRALLRFIRTGSYRNCKRYGLNKDKIVTAVLATRLAASLTYARFLQIFLAGPRPCLPARYLREPGSEDKRLSTTTITFYELLNMCNSFICNIVLNSAPIKQMKTPA